MAHRSVIYPIIGSFLLAISVCGQSQEWHKKTGSRAIKCQSQEWELVFEDNFDGSQLDNSKWNTYELAYGKKLSPTNIFREIPQTHFVDNGTLKVLLIRDSMTILLDNSFPKDAIMRDGKANERRYDFSGCAIQSRSEIFQYGKYEIKCRLLNPCLGMWPAFWTHSGLSEENTPLERRWCELDIFEIYYKGFFNSSRFVYTNNMHFDWNGDGGTKNEQYAYRRNSYNYFEEWHVFSCIINENEALFFIDGKLITSKYRFSKNISGMPITCREGEVNGTYRERNAWIRNPMFLFINMAMEGGNYPDDSVEVLPTYEVDYVRYWKTSK
ncbi:MAG: family 16 glycosylhydrolase [Flavobacteriales bacterium]|nr:family 16 glycosylhydrolase [Flavobacteriales bacterium]